MFLNIFYQFQQLFIIKMLWNTCECTGLSSTGKSKSIPPSILLLPLFPKYSDLASQLKTTSYRSLEEEEWQPLRWCSWPQSLWVLRCLAVVFWAPKVCQMICEESQHLGQSTWWPGPEFESAFEWSFESSNELRQTTAALQNPPIDYLCLVSTDVEMSRRKLTFTFLDILRLFMCFCLSFQDDRMICPVGIQSQAHLTTR